MIITGTRICHCCQKLVPWYCQLPKQSPDDDAVDVIPQSSMRILGKPLRTGYHRYLMQVQCRKCDYLNDFIYKSDRDLVIEDETEEIKMSAFDNATLMITGGTGSFGSTVLKHFLDSDLKEIRIFSRDEKKQDDMRHELQARHPEAAKKVKFYIGDVRNPQSIKDAMPGVDYIFHAAALKQVPSCEFFPMQAVQTNIIGTDNVLHAAIDAGVKRVVCLSTDKAAYPINAMGISKAMMEHVIYANARVAAERGGTTICCTRYGNVMCSRGSVIPLFIDQIKAGNPITITDPNMTR